MSMATSSSRVASLSSECTSRAASPLTSEDYSCQHSVRSAVDAWAASPTGCLLAYETLSQKRARGRGSLFYHRAPLSTSNGSSAERTSPGQVPGTVCRLLFRNRGQEKRSTAKRRLLGKAIDYVAFANRIECVTAPRARAHPAGANIH
ncbi:hypothetical protein AXG93_2374s1050 [Marchantia polymorpha subsp. ruderalis]|uniref:Uncharacterized protein n=1 Tax=Marchantia polymorpha subsp. ruderalis TaxID=1480154 RepID=A0A176WIX8_MARPO|nr:hypothetical protein AXG93_2374s1050 [Marchantia polymorpha subsp. ruderalis]